MGSRCVCVCARTDGLSYRVIMFSLIALEHENMDHITTILPVWFLQGFGIDFLGISKQTQDINKEVRKGHHLSSTIL